MIFPHTCINCGCTSEPVLIEVGQVLEISCGNCLTHVRYGHVREYPPTDAIKYALWEVCHRNTKEVVKLFDSLKQKPTRRIYWLIYRDLAKLFYNVKQKSMRYGDVCTGIDAPALVDKFLQAQ